MESDENLKPRQTFRDIARLELQFPTRLIDTHGDFSHYQDPVNRNTDVDLAELPTRIDKRWDEWSYEEYERARQLYSQLPSTEREGLDEFRLNKKRLFSDFAVRYLPAMRILDKGGLLRIPKTDEKGDITWRIVSEHSLVVGKVAETLATKMGDGLYREKVEREGLIVENDQQKSKIKEEAIQEVVVGALLQDVTKRQEVEFKRLLPEEKLSRIKALVSEGMGNADDIETAQRDIDGSFSIHERLLHQGIELTLREGLGRDKNPYGTIDTIILCTGAAGMPVVDRSKDASGNYLPTLAERVANFSDKLVQDSGLVPSLQRRRRASLARYSPAEKVNREYDYAQKCADEFASALKIPSGDLLPEMVIDDIFQQIFTVSK